MFIRAKT